MTIGDIDDESPWRIGRWLLALAGLPPVYFLGELICQAKRGRWHRVLAWLIVFVVATTTLALVTLRIHGSRPELALQPLERYSTDGWYLIGPWGAYFTGIVVLVVVIVKAVTLKIRSRLGRRA